MPEFFEVKRIKDYLIDSGISGDLIYDFKFKNNGNRILKNSSIDSFKTHLINNHICFIKTKAKYTLFGFKKGSFLIHYRFTGIPHIRGVPYGDRLKTIYSLPILNLKKDYVRFSIYFSSGRILDYYDTRCLSHLHFHKSLKNFNDYEHIKSLPNDLENFKPLTYASFKTLYKHSKLDVKTYLLDQTKEPSGIGNYLANEICSYAKINPWLLISSLSKIQYDNLFNSVNKIAQLSTKSSSYEWFNVFNKLNCKICNHDILKVRHKKNAQSTFYCPICQE